MSTPGDFAWRCGFEPPARALRVPRRGEAMVKVLENEPLCHAAAELLDDHRRADSWA